MPSPRQRFGTAAEARAADFVRQRGLTIIDQHVTSRYGEIDLLAEDGPVVVAIEVKARRNEKFGRAIEALTDAKLAKLFAALHDILERRGWQEREYRLDAVTIDGDHIEYHQAIG